MSALLASALPLSNVFVTKAMAKDVTVKVGGDIQAAIDQVSAANVAGRVVLEEGIYDLTETLPLHVFIPWEAIILPLHECSATILPFRTEPIFRRVRQTFPSSTASLSVMAVVA